MIKGTTKILGVIGHPIAHSLSPVMHNAAISHLGVDFVYLAFPVNPEDLKVALLGFGAIGVRGFSVTIPHKQAILPLLSEVSPIARAIGAVNTVYLTDKGWCGTNTDVEGFLAPLQTGGFPTLQSDSESPHRGGQGAPPLKVPLVKGDLGGSNRGLPDPLAPPQPPLTRGELEQAKSSNCTGGNPLKVPLVKGDLGGSNRGLPDPLAPPQPPLTRGELEQAKSSNCTGGNPLKVPLVKGDLGGSNRGLPDPLAPPQPPLTRGELEQAKSSNCTGGNPLKVPLVKGDLADSNRGLPDPLAPPQPPLTRGELEQAKSSNCTGGNPLKVPLVKGDLGDSNRGLPAPLAPPQPPLTRGELEQAKSSNCTGGNPLKVPLVKGDLGGSNRGLPDPLAPPQPPLTRGELEQAKSSNCPGGNPLKVPLVKGDLADSNRGLPDPLDPPQPPLTRGELEQAKSSNCPGGNPLKVPLVKGDLADSNRGLPDPLDPPQPPLTRGELEQAKSSNCTGGNPLKVPLVKGDLGGSPGLITSSRDGSDWSQKVAVILGNGGAARAVVAGCAQLGCAEIHVVGRNQQNLAEFQQSWVNSSMPVKSLRVHTWDNLSSLISQADLLVNTTPVGMYPQGEMSPVSASAMDRISPGAIAYDLIYNPNPTQFLKDAQQRGARAIDGLEMLVQQGAAALKIWLNQESVPVDVMRLALRKHLGLD